ncbi:MAG: hypothetical protein JWP79_504 [Polaromonas sp.]|jgi:hypothetical protein|nr:hypothetical protein [Polaromonas sp.]
MQVLRIFSQFDAAEKARHALLEAGFEPDSVELVTRADEAGGVQGNFVAGNAKQGAAADGNYEANFKNVSYGGIHLLSAFAASADAAGHAIAIMEQFGGHDMDGGAT